MLCQMNRELVCILSVSIAFMLHFAADFSMSNMQKVVVSSIEDDNPGFKMEGYKVTAIVFTLFTIFVWIGPFVTYRIGPKQTMLLASLAYVMYVSFYLFELGWLIYIGAVVQGMAAGILWPALGQYVITNSSLETTSRNFGIFNTIFCSAEIFGNIFVYTEFHGKKYLDGSTRRSAIYSLIAINIATILALMCLPKTKGMEENHNRHYGVITTLKTSWNLLISKTMLWLAVTYIYAGIQQAFWTGIYSSCIGFTLGFGNSAKELVALSGIVMGIGAMLGSLLPIMSAVPIRQHRFSRCVIISAGVFAQLVTYLTAFVNLPDSSVFGNTEDRSLIEPKSVESGLALLGSVCITFGEACLTTQIYAFLGDNYRDASAEACAIYKFVKSAVVAVSFYTCGHVGLHTQLPIMAATALAGVAAFWVADGDNVSYEDRTAKPTTEPETTEL